VLKQNDVVVYPNPATAQLTISATDNITNIAICNLLGQVVYEQEYNAQKMVVNVAELPNGMYLLKINGSLVKKFFKE
jgi:hypothetical protein